MRKYALLMSSLLVVLPAFAQEKENDRLKESYTVLKEILATPDKGVPADLLNKSVCVVVYPSVKKAAFIVGGSYGRGAMMCRTGQDHAARGVLPPCTPWKEAVSASRSAARRPISCCLS
jgi:lipid-binding SYLF domain-containing protein